MLVERNVSHGSPCEPLDDAPLFWGPLLSACNESSARPSGDGGSSGRWAAAVGAPAMFAQTFDDVRGPAGRSR